MTIEIRSSFDASDTLYDLCVEVVKAGHARIVSCARDHEIHVDGIRSSLAIPEIEPHTVSRGANIDELVS